MILSTTIQHGILNVAYLKNCKLRTSGSKIIQITKYYTKYIS